jgi:hypothetical protein
MDSSRFSDRLLSYRITKVVPSIYGVHPQSGGKRVSKDKGK